jgi:hypothetical protein
LSATAPSNYANLANDSESLSQKQPQTHEQANAQFFPEAIGSSMFIERNGRLNLSVVLRLVFRFL